MKVLIQSDELAKDVASAESLLERHQEHKVLTAYKCCYFMNLQRQCERGQAFAKNFPLMFPIPIL